MQQQTKDPITTPLMQQYRRIKKQYPHTILLFRVGDFYETFDEDAHKLHQITDIKLTKRSNGAAAAVPLAGFPHHALDNYLTKLVQAGLRVAVCDQLEAPQKGKKVVQRGVTELITPGITYNDSLLDSKKNNYLASLHLERPLGISFLDISTGEFLLAQGDSEYILQLLQRFQPAELIFSKAHKKELAELTPQVPHTYTLENWVYQEDYARQQLQDHFHTTTLKGFGVHHLPQAIKAAGATLHYLKTTEHTQLGHITKVSRIEANYYMWLDRFTIQSLELTKEQQPEGLSLIGVLDKTLTPMGGRKLKKWLLFPQQNIKIIQERHQSIALLVAHAQLKETIQHYLRNIGDLERLASKVATQRINPRELYGLQLALEAIPPIIEELRTHNHPLLLQIAERLDPCQSLVERIRTTLKEDPPFQLAQGGYIRTGVSAELDHYQSLHTKSSAHLQQILEKERRNTQISSLKIGHNKIFGYYLEVTHTHKDKVPEAWIRKQTLTQAERYITPELKEYEEQIFHAQEHIHQVEQRIYQELLIYTQQFITTIQTTALQLATLDCYQSLAHVATIYNYTQPNMHSGDQLTIIKGRHPVIEYAFPLDQKYVPNDLHIDQKKEQILLITGPNMAGKSALLRQTALIVLMAHMGSFVPAEKADIPLTDKIFTRVGASDNLARQESTFMVEMNEMASILHNLTPRSLLIIDELGRGTGTSDGTALAQSILEYLHGIAEKPKTLFATHYHNLNRLTDTCPRIQNYKVAVRDVEGKIVFLHKLEQGSSQHSFGIHVAQMAGMPEGILTRATQVLQSQKGKPTSPLSPLPTLVQRPISSAKNQKAEEILALFQKIDPLTMTPIEALMKLQELCNAAAGTKKVLE